MINLQRFFSSFELVFGVIKKDKTRESLIAIIDYYMKVGIKIKQLEKLAYILATVRHECGPHLLPITENLNYSAQRLLKVWPSRFPTIDSTRGYDNNPEALGNRVYGGRLGNGVLEGYKYRGRGFVQITGYNNYKKFSELLGIDLINNPELATNIDVGVKILVDGMLNGLFTGRKLSGYINSGKLDYLNARDIINADKGRVGKSIEQDAYKFLDILFEESFSRTT